MDDIQNDQKPAQKADTDLEKAIVPSAHSNQQIESKKESSPNSEVEQPTPDSASAVETDPKSPAKSTSPSNQMMTLGTTNYRYLLHLGSPHSCPLSP